LIDNVIGNAATSRKSGYDFTTIGGTLQYTARANPATPGTTGTRRFFVDATGSIRANTTAPAGANDPPIQ
jgi:hypothetical protein